MGRPTLYPLHPTPGRQRDSRVHGVHRGQFRQRADEEIFRSTLKIELVYRNAWRTREEADNALFAYIDGWYNPHRIQKDLGWLSPDEYEAAWYAQHHGQPQPAIVQPEPTGAR